MARAGDLEADLGNTGWSKPRPGDIVAFGLCAIVVLAPFPVGSLDAVWVGTWIVALSLVLIFHRRDAPGWALALAATPMLVAALAYGGVATLQTLGLTPLDGPHPASIAASRLLGPGTPTSPFAIPDPGLWYVAPAVASLLACMAGLVVGADSRRALLVIKCAAWGALAWIGFGLLQMIFDFEHVVWTRRLTGSRFTGTFLNPNTSATYFGSMSVVFLVLALDALRRELPKNRELERETLEYMLVRPPRAMLVNGLLALLCLLAVLGTASRAGIGATGIAILVVAFAVFRHRFRSLAATGLFVAILSVGTLVAFALFGGQTVRRFSDAVASEDGRRGIFLSVWEMIVDRPWLGHGLGAFEWAFPAYRVEELSIRGIVTRAHSVPLQMAAEIGLPATLVVLLACFAMFVMLWRGAMVERRRRAVPIISLGVMIVGFAHALVDFSLQIPGYAIVFWAIVGVGLGNVAAEAAGRSQGASGASASRARGRASVNAAGR
jgi:hypothetical protein